MVCIYGQRKTKMSNSTGKVALVTGANKGLGKEIARQLGKQGITVLIGARDDAKGEQAARDLKAEGIDARPLKLEVTSPADIQAAAQQIEATFGKLDILVNNAGVLLDREGVTPETFRQTYEANVIAPWELTQALLPLLKKSDAGRIVNHSSILGSITMNGSDQIGADWLAPAYNSSKAALNLLTAIQARFLEGTSVKVNAAHPGWVKTDLGTESAPLEVPEGAETAVWLATLPPDGPTGGFFHKGEPLPW
jgi:NAD(P)-dependent dehydrogenase (short-subunit alcohol dehydrogenase family)